MSEGTGLFCEGCNHEFRYGETMLLTHENDSSERMEAFCVDCLAFELAEETATPEEFCGVSRTANNGVETTKTARHG